MGNEKREFLHSISRISDRLEHVSSDLERIQEDSKRIWQDAEGLKQDMTKLKAAIESIFNDMLKGEKNEATVS